MPPLCLCLAFFSDHFSLFEKSNWIIQLCAACPIGTLCVVVVVAVVGTDAALPWYDTCLLFLNYIKYLKHMQI